MLLFLIQIASATRFAPARDIDPGYATALLRARGRGVEAIAYTCVPSLEGIALGRPVPIVDSEPQ